MAEHTTADRSAGADTRDLEGSYAYRLGRAVALLQALVDPPSWADDETIERTKDHAREFIAEEVGQNGQLGTLLGMGGGR